MRFLLPTTCLLLTFVAASQSALAQNAHGTDAAFQTTQSTTALSAAQTNADENFELDIASRRITENNYQASTAIETNADNARGVNLRVGVFLNANRIDVSLRNVRGQVRFRGSLERVLERLNLHRFVADPAP